MFDTINAREMKMLMWKMKSTSEKGIFEIDDFLQLIPLDTQLFGDHNNIIICMNKNNR